MKSLVTTNARYRLFGTSIAALLISLGINRVQAHSKCDSLANATSAVAAIPGAWPAAGFQVGYYTAKWIDETWFSSSVMPGGGLVNPPALLTDTQYLGMCPMDTDLDFKPVWDGALTLVQKAHPVSLTIAQWKIARQDYQAAILANDQTAALQALIMANSLQRTGMEQFVAYKDYYRTYARILHDAGKSFEAGQLAAIPGPFQPPGVNEAYVRSIMQDIVNNGAPPYEQQFFELVGIAPGSISTTGVLAPALAYVNDTTPDPFLTAEVLTSPASLYYAVSAAFESEVRGALDSKLPADFRPIMFAGLNHLPLGQAVLTSTTNGHVSVDNLGSSGQDGVEIRLPGVASWDGHWQPMDPDGTLPVGASVHSEVYGTAGSISSGLLGSWSTVKISPTEYSVSADMSPLGAGSVTVQMYNGAALVGTTTMSNGPLGFVNGCVDDDHWGNPTSTGPHGIPKRWGGALTFRNPLPFTYYDPVTSDAIIVVCDRIAVLPEGGATVRSLSKVSVVTTGIAAFTIDQEHHGLHYAGLSHSAIGQANVQVLDRETTGPNPPKSSLLIGNIGSSGQDGVSIALPASESFTTSSILNPADPENSYMTANFFAPGGTGAEAPAGLLCMRRAGTGYSAVVDFAPIGAPTYKAEVFRQGTLVATSSGLTGEAVSFIVLGPIRVDCVCTYIGPNFYNWSWTWRFSKSSTATTAAFTVPGSPGGGSVDGDLIVFTPEFTASAAPVPPTRVDLVGANIPDFTILGESIGFRGLDHAAVGGGIIDTHTGNLALHADNLGSSGQDGVDIRLSNVASCDFSWLPLDLYQLSPIGAWIQTDFSGTVNGLPDQSLGHARVTRVDSSPLGYEMSADLTPLASPTVLVEVWNHNTLVASLPGTPSGVFGSSSRWPTGGGKTGRGVGDWVLGCISWDYPDLTNFQIQGGGSYVGTRVLMLQESAPVANYLSGCRISASGVSGASATTNGFTLTGETTTPLPSPSGFAKIRFDCTYKLIPPTCTWTIVRSTTTTPDAFAGVVYHLQEAVQVPTDYIDLQLVVRGSNGTAVPFALSLDVAAKAQDLHPAPPGYIWVGFQSAGTFGNSTGANLLEVYSSRVAFRTAEPANTAGASWFGSDAPAGSGHPSGEIYQAFTAGPPPDLDDDGIPDFWESAYGLNPNLASDAALDLDGDGTSNGLEYLAGTNPTDIASVLRLDILSASSESVHLQFEAAAGKTYVIEESSGLSTWETTEILQSATVPHTTDVVRSYPPPRKFYRVRMSW